MDRSPLAVVAPLAGTVRHQGPPIMISTQSTVGMDCRTELLRLRGRFEHLKSRLGAVPYEFVTSRSPLGNWPAKSSNDFHYGRWMDFEPSDFRAGGLVDIYQRNDGTVLTSLIRPPSGLANDYKRFGSVIRAIASVVIDAGVILGESKECAPLAGISTETISLPPTWRWLSALVDVGFATILPADPEVKQVADLCQASIQMIDKLIPENGSLQIGVAPQTQLDGPDGQGNFFLNGERLDLSDGECGLLSFLYTEFRIKKRASRIPDYELYRAVYGGDGKETTYRQVRSTLKRTLRNVKADFDITYSKRRGGVELVPRYPDP